MIDLLLFLMRCKSGGILAQTWRIDYSIIDTFAIASRNNVFISSGVIRIDDSGISTIGFLLSLIVSSVNEERRIPPPCECRWRFVSNSHCTVIVENCDIGIVWHCPSPWARCEVLSAEGYMWVGYKGESKKQ